jgi:hypothetical protein
MNRSGSMIYKTGSKNKEQEDIFKNIKPTDDNTMNKIL